MREDVAKARLMGEGGEVIGEVREKVARWLVGDAREGGNVAEWRLIW